MKEIVVNSKLHCLDAVDSLITTARRWLKKEFEEPQQGVEIQTLESIYQMLDKIEISLRNLTEQYSQEDEIIKINYT